MMLGQRWPDIFTHIGSMGFQCWAGLLVTLGQRWPNVAHIRPTLVQCWTNVMRKLAIHWANVGPTCWGNIGPMSKITLGQRHLPTLAQCNWLHWPNIGPTLACYLGESQDNDSNSLTTEYELSQASESLWTPIGSQDVDVSSMKRKALDNFLTVCEANPIKNTDLKSNKERLYCKSPKDLFSSIRFFSSRSGTSLTKDPCENWWAKRVLFTCRSHRSLQVMLWLGNATPNLVTSS